MLIAIIWRPRSLVSTWVGFIRPSSSTKPNSRVTGIAIFFIITNDTDSRFRIIARITTNSIEPFVATVVLQGGIRTNQWLPRVTTQRGVAVLPISDQRVQGVRLLVDDNKLDRLLTDLHTEADLGEVCCLVGRSFVSCESNSVFPPLRLKVSLLLHRVEL